MILTIIWRMHKSGKTVSKRAEKMLDTEKFDIKNVNDVEVKEEYQVEM